jgi:hypothetical protein
MDRRAFEPFFTTKADGQGSLDALLARVEALSTAGYAL